MNSKKRDWLQSACPTEVGPTKPEQQVLELHCYRCFDLLPRQAGCQHRQGVVQIDHGVNAAAETVDCLYTNSTAANRRVSQPVNPWLASHMQTSAVTDALHMAWFRRRPAPGLIFHSDRGSQVSVGPTLVGQVD